MQCRDTGTFPMIADSSRSFTQSNGREARSTPIPWVTVGVPVYNGESFIAAALQSLLDQTYFDFEIIISDNASTDATERICRSFALRDNRIRYIRQTENAGASPNFNLLVPLARGTLFKWAAADDVLDPDFLKDCVVALEQDKAASLACTHVTEIDNSGAILGSRETNTDFSSSQMTERFSALLPMRSCYEIFGLIRIEYLRRTNLIIGSSHGDGVLLCALGMQGPFAIIPKPLFLSRKHEHQSMSYANDRNRYSEWFDRKNRRPYQFPYWRMFAEFTKLVFTFPMTVTERLICLRAVAAFAWAKRRTLRGDVLRNAKRLLRSLSRLTASRSH